MPKPKAKRWVVLKFGGTSVSTKARWQTIAEVVGRRIDEGFRPLVVCSALAGVSNVLADLVAAAAAGRHQGLVATLQEQHRSLATELGLDGSGLLTEELTQIDRLAQGISLVGEAGPRVEARLMAQGELMATRLGCAFLRARGLNIGWQDARDALVALDEPGLSERRRALTAACNHEPDEHLQERFDAAPEDAIITQGFIARGADGETVLLGRGGSDTSAATLAAKLRAARCEIWTDVPGMYTANPRQIPAARLLRAVDYDEAQEIASTGAKVLHPRCIAPVRSAGIPLVVQCIDRPELSGTMVSARTPAAGARVKAISVKGQIFLVSMATSGMWQEVGFLADVFACFKRAGLSVDLVSTSEMNVTVSIDGAANTLDPRTLTALLRDLEQRCTATVISDCAAISLVGRNIRAILHRLGPVFEVFEEQKVHLLSQAASDLNLTFVVDGDQAARLVRMLHDQLFYHQRADALFGPSWEETFEPTAPPAGGTREPWWRRRRLELLTVAQQQSPAYVYDEPSLREAVEELRTVAAAAHLLYAVKANPHRRILRTFAELGLGFECVSPGEVAHVQSVVPELDPERILFTPNFAPRDEYAWAIERGVQVTLDNLYPLQAWTELFAGQELFVRLDPGRGRGHHEHVRTAGATSKFGVAPDQLDELGELLGRAGARVVGLHAHLGSGIRTVEDWANTAVFLATMARRFETVRVLDLGGGLGVPERLGQSGLDLPRLNQSLEQVRAVHPSYELWLEPGRFLVARAGVLLATVTQTKRKGHVAYVGVDAGMNTLIRPALYGAYHEIVNLTRLDEPPAMVANVVGPICESGDTLGYSRRLPATTGGDVMLLATAGAYGRAMSSHYNMREPAREVVLT